MNISYKNLALGTTLAGLSVATVNNQAQMTETLSSIAQSTTEAFMQNPGAILCSTIGTSIAFDALTDYTNASYLGSAYKGIRNGAYSAISAVGLVTLFRSELPTSVTSAFTTDSAKNCLNDFAKTLDNMPSTTKRGALITGGILVGAVTLGMFLKAAANALENKKRNEELNAKIERAEKGDLQAGRELSESFYEDITIEHIDWHKLDSNTQFRLLDFFKNEIKQLGKTDKGEALFKLACLFDQGLGVLKNPNTAMVCLKKSADLGNIQALGYLSQPNFLGDLSAIENNATTQLIAACLGEDPTQG